MDKLSCLSVQTPYSNLVFVWWKSIFLFLFTFHFVLLRKLLMSKSIKWRRRRFGWTGCAEHVGQIVSVLRNVVDQCMEICLFCGLQNIHWFVWTVFVEYHKGVFNLWAGATKCHLRYHRDSNRGRNLGYMTWHRTLLLCHYEWETVTGVLHCVCYEGCL